MNNIANKLEGWLPDLDPRCYPVRLPHVNCVGKDLYLGERLVDKLTEVQYDFLMLCDGTKSFQSIISDNSIETAKVLHLSRFLLWWTEPVNQYINIFDECDKLILTSRPEDPWLGMGGNILNEARSKKVVILTLFSSSPETINFLLYKGSAEFKLACLDECILAARLSGISHVNWNLSKDKANGRATTFKDGLIRPDLKFFQEIMLTAVSKYNPSEIFIPGSLALNDGSGIIFNSMLTLAAEGYLSRSVHIYEDVPSILGYRHIDEFYSRFEDSYLTPSEYYTEISDSGLQKYNLLRLFICNVNNSQKEMWFNSDIRNAQLFGQKNCKYAERYWKLNFFE